MARKRGRTSAVVLAVVSAAASLAAAGCVVAGAGAGAGGAIYFTSRGVESVVAAPVDTVADATTRTFEEFGIQRTELKVEGDGDKRQFKGKPEGEEEPEVTVTLEREGERSTQVQVTARNSLVTWDKDYARRVIERIVELSGQVPRLEEDPEEGGS